MKKFLTIVILLIFTIPCYAKIKSIYNYENNDENSILKLLSCDYETKTSELEIKVNIHGRIIDSNNNPVSNKNLNIKMQNHFVNENLDIKTDEKGYFVKELTKTIKTEKISDKTIKKFNKSLMDTCVLIGLADGLKLNNCFSVYNNSFDLKEDDSFSYANQDSSIIKNFIEGQTIKISSPIGVMYQLKNISDDIQISKNNLFVNEKNHNWGGFPENKNVLGLIEENVDNNNNIITDKEVELYSKRNKEMLEIKNRYMQDMYNLCSDNNFTKNKKYDYVLNGQANGKLASLYLKNTNSNNDTDDTNIELNEYALYEKYYETVNINELNKQSYTTIFLVNLTYSDKNFVYCFDNDKEQMDFYWRKKLEIDKMLDEMPKGKSIWDNYEEEGQNRINISYSKCSVPKENKDREMMLAKIKADYIQFQRKNKNYAEVNYTENKQQTERGNISTDYFDAKKRGDEKIDRYYQEPIFADYYRHPDLYKKIYVVAIVQGKAYNSREYGLCVPNKIFYYFFTDIKEFKDLWYDLRLPATTDRDKITSVTPDYFYNNLYQSYEQYKYDVDVLFKTYVLYIVNKDNVWYVDSPTREGNYFGNRKPITKNYINKNNSNKKKSTNTKKKK